MLEAHLSTRCLQFLHECWRLWKYENKTNSQVFKGPMVNCHCKSKWKKVNLKAWSIKKAKYSFNDMVVTCSSKCHQSIDAIFLSKSRKHIYCRVQYSCRKVESIFTAKEEEEVKNICRGLLLLTSMGWSFQRLKILFFMEGITKLYRQ